MYLITRNDLSFGAQASQLVHAAIEFGLEWPGTTDIWNDVSNTIVLLSVDNEVDLIRLLDKVKTANVRYSTFYEPDINNELTAIVLAPTETSRKLCKSLKLAFRDKNTCACSSKEEQNLLTVPVGISKFPGRAIVSWFKRLFR